jgi:uncharacterized membrane protein YgcG
VSLLTGGEWLVALLVSPSERVAVKALRLALALVKTPSNRALVFGDGAPRSCGDAGLTGDMLGAVFHLATQHAGSETLRVLCLRLVHAAVSDVGQPLVRVLSQSERGLDGVSQSEHGLGFPNQSYSSSSIDGIDQREHGLGGLSQWDRGLDGPDTLMELILRDTCPAVQTEAARVLLTLVSKDGAVATGLGDRAAVRAMRPLLSRIWGAAIPRDDPETICDAPKAGDNAPSEIKIQNSYKSEVQDQAAAADSDAESDHGRNLLTDVFGVSATYISPPPRPQPTPTPLFPFLPASSSNGPGELAFIPLVLRLIAAVLGAHQETRESAARQCGWALAFAEKTGRAPPDEGGDDDDEGEWSGRTWVSICLDALRDPTPAPAESLAPGAEVGGEGGEDGKETARTGSTSGGRAGVGDGAGTSGGGGGGSRRGTSRGSFRDDNGGKEDGSANGGKPAAGDAELAEEAVARVQLGIAARAAQQAVHDDEVSWLNGNMYAAAISVLIALSAEVDVCREIVATPGGLARIIAVIPTTFATVEEGALLLTTLCDRGTQSHLRFDELKRAGLVEKLKDVAAALAIVPRPQRKVNPKP